MRMCSLQPAPVGGRLSEFVEGWKHITNDPFVLSIVTKGYRLRFTSPPLLRETPWEIRSPQEPEEIQGMLEQISLLLQKNAVTEVLPNSPGFYSNVFLVRKASGGWPPVIDLKSLIRVQDRPAGCILSCTNTSKQQEVSQVCLQKQGLSVPGTSLRSEHSPSDFYSLGHTVTGYLHRLGISVIPYLDDWLVHYPDRQVLLQHQVQLLKTLDP